MRRQVYGVAVVVVIGALLWSAGCRTPGQEPGRTVRLLTVGNSFSRNATRYLGQIARADGQRLEHLECPIWGGSMQQHWEKACCHEQDPRDPKGLYYSGVSLKQALQSAPWDYVTIQQASMLSHDVNTYRPYAARLFNYIKTNAPQAEVLLHQTWAYRSDDPRFSGVTNGGASVPASQKAMYEGLSRAYETIARELGVRRIPVGDAFFMADTDPQWAYWPDDLYDFKHPHRPELPNQTNSLHVGWTWAQSKEGAWTLKMDGHHAGKAGEYLAGCVFYEVIFGRSVVGNRFIPPGLSWGQVSFLQGVAHRAVRQSSGQSLTQTLDGKRPTE